MRSRFGAKPVPKNDILRRIVENKRNGRLFLAGFIGDQTPNRANLNFWMEFLNQDTPILVGTEKIARKFGLPVISLKMRKGIMRWILSMYVVIPDNWNPGN